MTLKQAQQRVFRHTNRADAFYYIKIFRDRKRENFNLYETDRRIAAAKAQKLHQYLKVHGWELTLALHQFIKANGWAETLAKYGDNLMAFAAVPEEPDEPQALSVGAFLGKVANTSKETGPRTMHEYQAHFRRLVADIAGIERGTEKYAYRSDSRAKWIAKVDKLPLSILSREAIAKWMKDYVGNGGQSPAAIASRRTSCNTILRAAKSLFGTDRLEDAGLLEINNPFAGVKFYKRGDHRYRGGIDLEKLISAALEELPVEPLKALLLASCAGFRKTEIDRLQWSAFSFPLNMVTIKTTDYLKPKSERGTGSIDLDPQVSARFAGWFALAGGNPDGFVLEGEEPRLGTTYGYYRSERTFAELATWLRGKGLGRSPIHELRKMYGSRINEKFGIQAASTGLRHSSIAITSDHYISKRQQSRVDVGHLFEEATKIVPLQAAQKEGGSEKALAPMSKVQ